MDQNQHRFRYFTFPLLDRDARLQAVRTAKTRSGLGGGAYAIADLSETAGTPGRLVLTGEVPFLYVGRTCSFRNRMEQLMNAIRGGVVRHSFTDWVAEEPPGSRRLENLLVFLVPSPAPTAFERFAAEEHKQWHGQLPPGNRRFPSRCDSTRREPFREVTWDMLFPKRPRRD
jgi:hypothetical protein